MRWEATDQFGNLYVGSSDARNVSELTPDLAMLVDELHRRTGEGFKVRVDFEYGEICGPDPDQVSHIVSIPWLGEAQREETLAAIQAALESICADRGIATPPLLA